MKNQSDKFTYKIKLDIKKDAWNWWSGCNSFSHGMDWGKGVPENILSCIRDKSEDEAYEYIFPFLRQKYVDEKDKITASKNFIEKRFNEDYINACKKLEDVMGKPLYRNNFTVYQTTFPRGPYNYEKGFFLEYIEWTNPIAGFLHELSHFQFIHYWRNNPNSEVSKLSYEHFDWLKESLTIILDEDFLPIIERVDRGYEIHGPFRKQLREFWKTNHDFDKLVDFGLKILPNYVQ
ncbi:MAG: hypothetical protein PHW82_16980 [Bacteroidales bacterium]|nr:hypothetical protein [Bacteroidales bacterium]